MKDVIIRKHAQVAFRFRYGFEPFLKDIRIVKSDCNEKRIFAKLDVNGKSYELYINRSQHGGWHIDSSSVLPC